MISIGEIDMTGRNDAKRRTQFIPEGDESFAKNANPDDDCVRRAVSTSSVMPTLQITETTLDATLSAQAQNYNGPYGPRENSAGIIISRNIAVFLVVALVSGFLFVHANPQLLHISDHREEGGARAKADLTSEQDKVKANQATITSRATPSVVEKASTSRESGPTSIDSAYSQLMIADEAFSRLKLELIDLQRAEQNNQNHIKQADRITVAMATGLLELHLEDGSGNKSKIQLVYVPPGWFQMGHTEEQRINGARASSASHYDFSVPDHLVHVNTGYFIGIYEVPNFQMQLFVTATRQSKGTSGISSNLSDIERFKPATSIDWGTAMHFCDWLSEQNQISVRLPSEIEWEYAARGNRYVQQFESQRETGVVIGGPWPVNQKTLDRGWCGTYGLRDNVQEWCIDAWNDDSYLDRSRLENGGDGKAFEYSPSVQPVEENATLRSVRGSSYRDVAANIDPALRRYKAAETLDDTVGFRIVVPVPADLYNRMK